MVIDTDILIDHFHNNPAASSFIRSAILSGEPVYIFVVSIAEILTGMRPGEEERTEKLFALFTNYVADDTIARIAGHYLNQFASNHRLDLGNALIAATAKMTDSTLYTRNVQHYPMPDIVVKAPYQRGEKNKKEP